MSVFGRTTALFAMGAAIFGIAIGPAPAPAQRVATDAAAAGRMPAIVEKYTADRMNLNRTYPLAISPAHVERFDKFYHDNLALLAAMDFNSMSQEDKVDYLLLKNLIDSELHQAAIQKRELAEM